MHSVEISSEFDICHIYFFLCFFYCVNFAKGVHVIRYTEFLHKLFLKAPTNRKISLQLAALVSDTIILAKRFCSAVQKNKIGLINCVFAAGS